MSRGKCRFLLPQRKRRRRRRRRRKEGWGVEEVVDVWDESPFVPRQGHCTSSHNVDTPETARIPAYPPPPLLSSSSPSPPPLPSSVLPSAPSAVSEESDRNAFFSGYFIQ